MRKGKSMTGFEKVKKNFGFGCMRLPMKGSEVDYGEFSRMVDTYIAAGFNYFDTARVYLGGKSETAIRECIAKRYPREAFVLADKLSASLFNSREEIRPLFEKQLESCGVEYFDFYLMHSQNRDVFEKYKRCHAYEQAFELKKEGKVRHVGLSFHDKADVLEDILKQYPQVEFVQIQLNYLDWEDCAVQSHRCYDVCKRYGKPVIVMEPIKGGSLAALPEEAEKLLKAHNPCASAASWAIRYAASLENVMIVLSGMSSMEQVADNIGYMQDFHALDAEERAVLDQVVSLLRKANTIGCTGCHYCTDGCPQQIPIPEIFKLYNNYMKFPKTQDHVALNYYGNVTSGRGNAASCMGCGQCEEHCPQHLEIPKLLKDVSSELQKL